MMYILIFNEWPIYVEDAIASRTSACCDVKPIVTDGTERGNFHFGV